ncbi:MAG: 2-(1,2-epoxy,2-dihydrophenyl)acetyl-CoA isomerase, partial [Cryptosporangiaceae bacterium]|nr:2-(1,2-epoxy,2-dihydrophenyl)acetyl-CoA isomerase [Cryptosporangiaceae bacterium]
MTEPLLLDRAGGVATLTLNRPSSLNALSLALKESLIGALAEVRDDPSVRAVVLAGAGGAFCTGQDLREHAALLASGDPAPLRTVAEHYNPITSGIATMPKPVVAAVRGIAAGAGAGFAFAADFRIGGPSTRFMLAFVNVGLAGDSGVSWTLQRLAGRARAVELLLLGEPLSAATAFSAGLLTELTETDEAVLGRAHELAARLATGPSVAYAQI